MYTCTHTLHTYKHTCKPAYVRTFINIQMKAYIQRCIDTCTQVHYRRYMSIQLRTITKALKHTDTDTHTSIHTRTITHTNTHKHTHTHTHGRGPCTRLFHLLSATRNRSSSRVGGRNWNMSSKLRASTPTSNMSCNPTPKTHRRTMQRADRGRKKTG